MIKYTYYQKQTFPKPEIKIYRRFIYQAKLYARTKGHKTKTRINYLLRSIWSAEDQYSFLCYYYQELIKHNGYDWGDYDPPISDPHDWPIP